MDRARKRELRELNERVWTGEEGILKLNSSLDSALKKNTAFIKRLRTSITATSQSVFLQELRTLSLQKYLSEITSACYEGLCKLKAPGDYDAATEVVSALHQRFGPEDFTAQLGLLLAKGITTPDKAALKNLTAEVREKEEKERPARQRVLLRVITDSWLVGVLRTLDDVAQGDTPKPAGGKLVEARARSINKSSSGAEPFPLEALKDLLGHDREHINLPLLVTFVKTYSWDILGIEGATSEGRRTPDEDDDDDTFESVLAAVKPDTPIVVDSSPLVSVEVQKKFKHIIKRYFDDVKTHLVRNQKAIVSQSSRNAEAYVRSGEIFEDRQANFEKQEKAQEKLVANAQVLADVLGLDMPKLNDIADPLATTNGGIGLVKAGELAQAPSDGTGMWQDDEERRFYENLVDLKGKVPGILLEDNKKKKPDADEQVGKKVDATENGAGTKVDTTDDSTSSIINSTIGAQVDALLLRLPELTSKEVIDQTAIDFCFLNSKASRNRLIKALTEPPKGRSDLLASWSRLIATLGQYMSDIPKGVVEYLDSEFRSLQARKSKDFLTQVRFNNIRYLAELTKFGVVQEHTIFHCLKVCLEDFSKMNIEIICGLLENCGRYLLKNPDTAPRMTSFLETLQRKKAAQHIGQGERMSIENAVYYVDPPARAAIQQKERTPMELYIRKLVYTDLTRKTQDKVARKVLKLHWEEKEVIRALVKVFTKPSRMKFGNIFLLACLLIDVYRAHTEFAIGIVDHVIESIVFGLEINDFRYYQRRIADVKYFGELFMYKLLDVNIMFDIMYKIVAYGHGGTPMPGRFVPLDPPDDFFRVRLIYTMLETIGAFLKKGTKAKKLDYFLSFFQYYIYTKDPLPMDIEFLVKDIYSSTRPDWQLAPDLESATAAFQTAIAEDRKTSGVEDMEEAEIVSSDDEQEEKPRGHVEDEDEADGTDLNADAPTTDFDDDEEIIVTREKIDTDPEEDAAFEREFAQMMAESLESRKAERKTTFDVPLPVRPRTRDATTTSDSVDSAPASPMMAFSLLTKKGNRQQTRTLELPSDNRFAVAMKSQQEAERAEQQRIKSLVLDYDARESEGQDGADTGSMTNTYTHRGGHGPTKGAQARARRLQVKDIDWT